MGSVLDRVAGSGLGWLDATGRRSARAICGRVVDCVDIPPPSPLVLRKIFELKTLGSDLDVWEAGLMRRSGGWPDRVSKLIAWVNYSGCVKRVSVLAPFGRLGVDGARVKIF